MHKVLVVGAGKIGSLITCLLTESGAYDVHLVDISFNGADIQRLQGVLQNFHQVCLDVKDENEVAKYIKQQKIQAVVSCLPYFCNKHLIAIAKQCQVHYFDLTEDVLVTKAIKKAAKDVKNLFVPQCGVAPGYIGIVANNLMQSFDTIEDVKLRVGALPINSSHALHYALTWSTDGLINEYANSCRAIADGSETTVAGLSGLEQIIIDGIFYEAFHTSGGLGGLIELYPGKIQNMNYKTIRYPGHRDKMRFLMTGLKLKDDRETLKKILEHSVPKTYQDVVIIYASVSGYKRGEYSEKSHVNKIYPQTIATIPWSAIQVTTATGLCAVMDLLLNAKKIPHGFYYQEQTDLQALLANRFGKRILIKKGESK